MTVYTKVGGIYNPLLRLSFPDDSKLFLHSAEACYTGWQESLILLAKLVEAEIPDQM